MDAVCSQSTHSRVNGFKQTKIGCSATAGERLKAARTNAGLTISQCAQTLSIQEQYLRALEEGEYTKLPGEVYGRGWVKKYAQFLGIPQRQLVEAFVHETRTQKTINHVADPAIPARLRANVWEFITLRRITYTLTALLLLGYVSSILYQSIAPPSVTFDTPLTDLRTPEDTIIIRGRTESGVSVFINRQLIDLDAQGGFEQHVSLREGVQTITIEARKKHSQSFTKEVQIIKTSPPSLESSETGP